VIASVRAAHVLGILTWAAWGLMIRQYTAAAPELDLAIRFLVLIPALTAGLAVTFLPIIRRVWEAEAVAVLLVNAVVWTVYVSSLAGAPFDLGYVGVILIMAFSYTLVRLRFLLMAGAGLAMIGLYFAAVLAVGRATPGQITLALYYLVSFYVLGMIASYTFERFTRLLFLRERQLAGERERSDSLLRNILPRAIAERLKGRADVAGPAPVVAEAHDDVAVLFADLASFTEQAGRTAPDALVACLNDLFSAMDALADQHGLEKIKTIGDAYMAVAGAPEPCDDHPARAARLALAMRDHVRDLASTRKIELAMRIGVHTGEAVAGVIGTERFSYDLWGDTVNTASRMESHGAPNEVQITAATKAALGAQFTTRERGPIEVKGRGTITTYWLDCAR
jgi:class 3 adenylate cyclase